MVKMKSFLVNFLVFGGTRNRRPSQSVSVREGARFAKSTIPEMTGDSSTAMASVGGGGGGLKTSVRTLKFIQFSGALIRTLPSKNGEDF